MVKHVNAEHRSGICTLVTVFTKVIYSITFWTLLRVTVDTNNTQEQRCKLGLSKTKQMPWRRKWHPTPIPLPGKTHGQRSLVGNSPWEGKESDTTDRLHFHFPNPNKVCSHPGSCYHQALQITKSRGKHITIALL